MQSSSINTAAPSQPPDEVLSSPRKTEDYLAWRAATDLRAPYRVAKEFLYGTKPDADFETDEAPLIVFINARSGGRVGPELAGVLARAVGSAQVFDLSKYRPDVVLGTIWRNLQHQELLGNKHAAMVRSRLRILACGGDGTVAWVLKVIQQLDLKPHPPVAIMPLGTGNDLSRSFLWGRAFEHAWIKGHASVYSTLKRVADAPVTDLDCWKLRLVLPSSSMKPAKTYALTQVDEQQQQQQQPSSGCAGEAGRVVMEGLFWNYFSVGADAQAAYNFHHLRDQHPMLASNRAANQFWYGAFSCTSGWFCGTLPSVGNFSSVQVLQPGSSTWSELNIPDTIKALVLVNLQSYAGGRNIWGSKPPKKSGRWRTPSVSDGLIEVVGFHSGYHAMAVMGSGAKLANGKRMAQVAGIRVTLRSPVPRPDGEPGTVFMQLDGEPWLQHVPASGDSHVLLEVVHAGVSKVLRNTAHPEHLPEPHITAMLGQQQAAAYLAAPQPQQEKLALEQQQGQRPVQLAMDDHAAAGMQPAMPGAYPGGALELTPAPQPGTAAHKLLQPPSRAAHTDGGAPCSSSTPAPPPGAAVPRQSVDVHDMQSQQQPAPGTARSPAPSTDVPSAVAVIETTFVASDGTYKRKVTAVDQGSGSKCVVPVADPPKQSPGLFGSRHKVVQ